MAPRRLVSLDHAEVERDRLDRPLPARPLPEQPLDRRLEARGIALESDRPPARHGPQFKLVRALRDDPTALSLDLIDLAPTPLIKDRAQHKVEIVPATPISRWRAFQIISLLVGHFFRIRFGWLFGQLSKEEGAVRTREMLEGLGGLWVKLGQILSLRTDFLDPVLCRELSRLQHRVAGFPWPVAKAVIEAELGEDAIERLFTDFDPEPFAAASIAQVHKARLRRNGRAVVIKVQRPEVERQLNTDLGVLSRLVKGMLAFGVGRQLVLQEGLQELRDVLREETDYRYEAANLRRMRKSLRGHGVYVPKVFGKLSTRRVLVMEHVPGVLMSDLIHVDRESPGRAEAWLAVNGIDRREVAEQLVVTVFRQVLEDNLFHADLHPGNIMLLRDSRICLIDFGSIGSLELITLELYKEINHSLARRDFHRAADYMLCMAPQVPTYRATELRHDLTQKIKEWESRSHLQGLPYAERGMSSVSAETSRVMTAYGVPPSWAMMRMGRTMGTLDASLQTLVPEANFLRLYDAYRRDWLRRRRDPRTLKRDLGRQVSDVVAVVTDARLLLGAEIRREALRLKGMLGSLQRSWAMIFSRIRQVSILFAFGIGIIWLSEHHRHLFPYFLQPWLKLIDDAVPDMHYMAWLTLAIVALVVAHLLRIARIMMRQPE